MTIAHRSLHCSSLKWLGAVFFAACFSVSLFADDPPIVDITWAGSQNGDITDISNWTSATPDWEDSFPDFIGTATVGSGVGPYTVTMLGDFTAMQVQNGVSGSGSNLPVITFLMNGYTMNLTSTAASSADASVYLYAYNDAAASLKGYVFDNGIVCANSIWLRGSSGGQGPTLVLQNGTQWFNAGVLTNSNTASSQVEIFSGSVFTATGSGVIYSATGGNGNTNTLRVSGAGSTFVARTDDDTPNDDRRTVNISSNASSAHNYLYVQNGASFSADQVNVGGGHTQLDRNSIGTVLVEGSGTTFEAKWVNLGASRTNVTAGLSGRADAWLVVGDGAEAEIEFLQVLYKAAGETYNATRGRVLLDGGTLLLTGNSVFQANTELKIYLYSPDQDVALTSETDLTISGAKLLFELDDTFEATAGQTISLIDYASLTGEFADLVEGQLITVEGYTFEFTYNLGGASIVGLTVVPEPRVYALIVAVASLGIVALRRRRKA